MKVDCPCSTRHGNSPSLAFLCTGDSLFNQHSRSSLSRGGDNRKNESVTCQREQGFSDGHFGRIISGDPRWIQSGLKSPSPLWESAIFPCRSCQGSQPQNSSTGPFVLDNLTRKPFPHGKYPMIRFPAFASVWGFQVGSVKSWWFDLGCNSACVAPGTADGSITGIFKT